MAEEETKDSGKEREREKEEMEKVNKALARIQKTTKLKVIGHAKDHFNTMQPNDFTREQQ